MAKSRSAFIFLQREGIIDETMSPAPRLNVTDMLVNTIPLTPPHEPSQGVLRDLTGYPTPDRLLIKPWPNVVP
jgi:hypothetical protein